MTVLDNIKMKSDTISVNKVQRMIKSVPVTVPVLQCSAYLPYM